jgi:hypothetical protein
MFFCAVFLGCRSANVEPPPPVEVSLQKLVVLYGQYLGRHRGAAPVDEAAFRKSIEGLSDGERGSRGLSDINAVFTSPRDKQPYVVRYGGKIGAPGPDGPPWVAYEKEGQGGKRYIGFATGQMEEVDERRLQEILSTQK